MKKMILTLALVMFAASASAQTLQDFESSFDDNFQKSLAGGEGFSGYINFSSGVDRSVPLVVEVTVESDETSFATGDMKGAEFDVSTILNSTGFDWKSFVWDRVQRGEGEILVPDDSVRENDSIPEAVYVSEESEPVFAEDPANISEDDFPGFTFVESRSELEDLDLTYDPENTPAAYVVSKSYSGDDYLPRTEAYPEDSILQGDRAREEFADGLNASDYSLRPAQFRSGSEGASIEDDSLVESIQRPAGDTLEYSFVLQEGAIYTGSQNSVLIRVGADQRIRPDSFDFSFEVRSEIGVISENRTEEVRASEPETVETGDTEVSVNASADANVTVQTVEQTSLPDPSPESDFVGGVSVDVSNRSGQVEASGNITVSYDQSVVDSNDLDEDSMSVYFFNESRGEWTSEGVEVVDRDTGENTVTADVAHFSTYAVFAEQQDDSTDTDDGSGGGDVIPFDPAEDEEETEPDTQDQTEESSEQDDSSGDQQEETTQDDGSSDQGDTGVEDSEQDAEDQTDTQQTPDTPTGQFFTSDTGIAGGLLILLVVLVVYLEYTGRIELRELKEVIKQKTSN